MVWAGPSVRGRTHGLETGDEVRGLSLLLFYIQCCQGVRNWGEQKSPANQREKTRNREENGRTFTGRLTEEAAGTGSAGAQAWGAPHRAEARRAALWVRAGACTPPAGVSAGLPGPEGVEG